MSCPQGVQKGDETRARQLARRREREGRGSGASYGHGMVLQRCGLQHMHGARHHLRVHPRRTEAPLEQPPTPCPSTPRSRRKRRAAALALVLRLVMTVVVVVCCRRVLAPLMLQRPVVPLPPCRQPRRRLCYQHLHTAQLRQLPFGSRSGVTARTTSTAAAATSPATAPIGELVNLVTCEPGGAVLLQGVLGGEEARRPGTIPAGKQRIELTIVASSRQVSQTLSGCC